MTWTGLTTDGRGTQRYRLMIEGWPEMFVTDPSITATSITDGRTVIAGLLYEGLQIQDRIIPAEAKISATGNTFKIRPPYGTDTTDPVLASLSVYPSPVAALGTSETEDSTTWALKGSGSLANDTYYHVGTETIYVSTWPTVVRQKWDTQAQEHSISHFDTTKSVFIYARPPTMEGRRCYLYGYGATDSGTGSGTLVWRGIVHRQPRLVGGNDGVTWLIEALPITAVLQQKVAGELTDTRPVGIYHHSRCTFGFVIEVFLVGASQIYRYPGNDVGEDDIPIDTEQTLIDSINALLAEAHTDMSLSGSVSAITLVKDPAAEGKFAFQFTCEFEGFAFRIVGGSPLLGWVDSYHDGFFYQDATGGADQAVTGAGALTDGVTYRAPFGYRAEAYKFPGNEYAYDGGGVAAPIGNAAAIFRSRPGMPDGFCPQKLFSHDTTGGGLDLFERFRIHTDKDISDASQVHIEGSLKDDGNFRVDGGDQTSKTINGTAASFNYISLTEISETFPSFGGPNADQATKFSYWCRSQGFYGILLAGSVITPIRQYGVGPVTNFVIGLKINSVEANDGDTPFITDADLSTWFLSGDVLSTSVTMRQFVFTRPKSLDAILAEECKFAGHLMRIESDGRIGIIPLPIVTDVQPVAETHQITGDHIITPSGSYGSWPEVEPQRDGLVTQISVQEMYKAVSDDWSDTPRVFQEPDAIATHKNRGKSVMDVRPYSRSQLFDRAYAGMLASRIFSFFARDYLVVTIQVPWSKFSILCGDTVSLTHRLIPDGTGSRGIVSRRGVVVERRWNLDPAIEQAGTLTIWINGEPLAGYAPGGLITDQADQGSNVWVLTLDSSNDFNIQVSTNGDGNILEHFAVGDAIRIVEGDATSPTVRTGTATVVSPSVDQIAVTLDFAWTPGSSDWYLEFGDETNCGDSQRKYAFAAASSLLRADGESFARRLS